MSLPDRVALEIIDGVATLTLVRSGSLNAIDEAMHAALRHAFTRIAKDRSVRAVVLTGSGPAFCAGQDLAERAATFDTGGQPDLHDSLDRNYNPLIRTIASLDVPVIAAVGGIAFGAGAALAIACDIVLAGRSARFQFGFVNVGLGPDSGASWSLPRIVGQARGLDLALTGRAVTAAEALEMGLVSRVVDDSDLPETAQAIARDLTARSADALAAIKRQFRVNPPGTLDAALDAERDEQAALGRTRDYREAVLRFAGRHANKDTGT
ncbi:enoyl-CoA hydratase-related protein [Novosphingobium endophyticum]|uniref:enoyl-CoA hydratase-related protein n=1 Tax=Novosphingobium endophyticum TaxID=1955250 RepID=UPI001E3E4C6B|nr:enoyl-CoA hydratase-related protein [Novosphingobium endophyticum]